MLDYSFNFKVSLNTIENLKDFCKIVSDINSDIMIGNLDRTQRVDASSIMGVFALDPSNVLLVETNDSEAAKILKEKIKKFIINQEEENE